MSAPRNTLDWVAVEDMLAHISPDCDRDTWIRIGMAVKAALGNKGYDCWDKWSGRGDKYRGKKETLAQWESMGADGGVGPGTLVHEARAAGWQPQHATQPAPTPAKPKTQQKRSQQADDEAAEQARAAAWAAKIWAAAESTAAEHPYVQRKSAQAGAGALRVIDAQQATEILGYTPRSAGEPLTGDLLVVPVKRDGELATLELIDCDGRKTALRGKGTRVGSFWAPCSLPDDGYDGRLLVGEGVATVTSAAEATGEPAVAALAAGNLSTVAQNLRERYPLADIVILADLDKKTGEAHESAIKAARAVGGRCARPKFTSPDPERKTDFNDLALEPGDGPAAVVRCIDRALRLPLPEENKNPILARTRISPFSAMRSPRPELDFVLPGLLRGTTGLIVAPGATGKTWFSLQLAASVAAGLPVCGGVWAQPEKTGRVLVLGWEDPEIVLQDRMHTLMHYLSDGQVSDAQLDLIDQNVDLISMHGDTSLLLGRDGDPGQLVDHLIDAARGQDYRLIILDPLARILGVDENDNGLATRAISMLEHVAHETGPAVVPLHHAAKYAGANGYGSEQTAARGASGLVDGARWMSTMQTMSAAEAEKLGVDDVTRRFWVKLAVPKANYCPPLDDAWLRREEGGPLARGVVDPGGGKRAAAVAAGQEANADTRPSPHAI